MFQQAVILLVDDDENDCALVRRAFVRADVSNPLSIVRSGEEAIEYLEGTGKYADRAEFPLPGLILLDVKMKGMDGLEVLRWIRNHPGLRSMRVAILTSSDDTREINLAYQLGANSFLTKPVDGERFVDMVRALAYYWLILDKAPDTSRAPLPKS